MMTTTPFITTRSAKTRRLRLAIGFLALLLLAAALTIIWVTQTPALRPEALAALHSDEQVQVHGGPWFVFWPSHGTPDIGLILYPGGRVDFRAYAPAAHAIAAQGYPVIIVPMPLNLAVLAPNKASQVMAAYPQIQRWFLAGHSLGGTMAARFVHRHPDAVAGLILWASYPAPEDSLATFMTLSVTSIYATRDGLVAADEIQASRALLPPDTAFIPVPGGNHTQFGWYELQAGDQPATISYAEQQEAVVRATLRALGSRM